MRDFLSSIGYMSWVLPALLAIPVVGAALVWATPTPRRRGLAVGADEVVAGIAGGPRWVAFWVLLAEFIVSLGLWWAFDPSVARWQGVVDRSWIPGWGVRFTIGI